MVTPYLSFQGTCEEAFRFYERVFGGKIQYLVRYGDAPDNAGADPSMKDKVMHAQMMLTETGGLSGADAVWPVESGSSVHIHVYMPDEATARRVFAELAEGGTVVGELQPNPPPDDSGLSGMLRDRFGFGWVISAMRDGA